MKRAVILFTAAALGLSGCSGKAKDPAAEAKVPAVGKDGKPIPAKPNPWNSGSAADAAAADPAKDKKATPPKADAKAASNPWAKGPPPGTEPTPDPADKAKK